MGEERDKIYPSGVWSREMCSSVMCGHIKPKYITLFGVIKRTIYSKF